MQFRYDAKGNLVSVCDAGGSTVYGYNNASEVVSIQEPGGNCAAVPVTGACSVVGYDDASGVYQDGRRTKMTLPPSTGIVINYTYDDAGNLLTVKAKKGASTVSSMTYTYTVGTNDTNLRRSSNINGTATNYGYDASNQLCWAGTGTGICTAPPSGAQRWTYDAVGNRTQQTIGSTTTSYAYNAANQLCATVTSGTPTCPSANWTYDGNGNLTHNPTITSLVYNAKNQNTARTQSGTTTNFVYADVGNSERTAAGATAQISDILGLASESNVRYLRDPSGTVLGERITSGASAGNYYFFTDGLGSVTHIVNSSGTYVRYYGYDAWGNTSIGSGTINSNIRYANGYADTNGLTKFGARYYDPTNGRWTQQDPAGRSGANRYQYAYNEPVGLADPSGYEPCSYVPNAVPDLYDWNSECAAHDNCYDSNGDRGFSRFACDARSSFNRHTDFSTGGDLNPGTQIANAAADTLEFGASVGTVIRGLF